MSKGKTKADQAVKFCIDHLEFETVLDIGCGSGFHSEIFKYHRKQVTSVDYSQRYSEAIYGLYEDLEFDPHDLTWACHVLEHQLNVNQFLRKVRKETKEGGYTCITVPPMKNSIVGGHVSFWNPGLLLYNMVLAGFNCKNAHVKSYNYNISVIAKAENFNLPKLNYDKGDINRLADFLPDFCKEKFDGNFKEYNWDRHNGL